MTRTGLAELSPLTRWPQANHMGHTRGFLPAGTPRRHPTVQSQGAQETSLPTSPLVSITQLQWQSHRG